jgi:hypothetical protein
MQHLEQEIERLKKALMLIAYTSKDAEDKMCDDAKYYKKIAKEAVEFNSK